ncbi:MAG: potassium transporter TrkG, partial [Oscillospiraceae bacterium]
MLLSLIVFLRDYSFWDALGISAFHSIAAFNNSGFDILGGLKNLVSYKDDILLNLTTCGLIISGGLGFFVIREIVLKRKFSKFSLHTKVVLFMTAVLLLSGTILLKLTENITWLGAFFTSTSARTAGFSTFSLGAFSNAGLFILVILMFIGASPGSTGGGIKTTTFFVLMRSVVSTSTNKQCSAFKRKLPIEIVQKAFIITVLAVGVVFTSTFLLCISEPETDFIKLFFEVVSAFGTVGLSTGITPDLCDFSKFIVILTMFIGRLGPLTIASLWVFKPTAGFSYAEESLTIG